MEQDEEQVGSGDGCYDNSAHGQYIQNTLSVVRMAKVRVLVID
jgi:hypothetical protein